MAVEAPKAPEQKPEAPRAPEGQRTVSVSFSLLPEIANDVVKKLEGEILLQPGLDTEEKGKLVDGVRKTISAELARQKGDLDNADKADAAAFRESVKGVQQEMLTFVATLSAQVKTELNAAADWGIVTDAEFAELHAKLPSLAPKPKQGGSNLRSA